MIDLDLRRHVNSVAPPLTLDEITAPPTVAEVRPLAPRRRVRPLTIAAIGIAAATVASLTVVATQLVDRREVVPAMSPSAARWVQVPDATGAFVAPPVDAAAGPPGSWVGVSAIAAYGDGYLAVGEIEDGLTSTAATWTSADGLTWTIGSSPDLTPAPNTSTTNSAGTALTGVVATGNTAVAVGRVDGADQSTTPAVWWTDDAMTWHRADLDASGSSGADLVGVVATDNGYLAYGNDAIDESANAPTAPVAWTSTDGRRWQQVDLAGLTTHGAHLSGIVRVGDRYMAFGLRGTFDAAQAAMWTSTDSLTWTPVTIPGAVGALPVNTIDRVATAADGTLLALGQTYAANSSIELTDATPVVNGDGDVVAWSSVDGLQWTQLDTAVLNTATAQESVVGVAVSASDTLLLVRRLGADGSTTQLASVAAGQVEVLGVPPVNLSGLFRLRNGYLAFGSTLPTLTNDGMEAWQRSARSSDLWYLPD